MPISRCLLSVVLFCSLSVVCVRYQSPQHEHTALIAPSPSTHPGRCTELVAVTLALCRLGAVKQRLLRRLLVSLRQCAEGVAMPPRVRTASAGA